MGGEFSGKRVVVIGAASGIGRACSELFARKGAAVFLADWDKKGVLALSKDLANEQLQVSAVHLDISDSEAVVRFLHKIVDIDVLVNAASILLLKSGVETSLEEWQRVIAINLTGTFVACKTAITMMLKRGKGGSIINFSSSTGNYDAAKGSAAYIASKGGVTLLTKALACEYGEHSIRVNAIAPGPTDTPMIQSLMSEQQLADLEATLVTKKLGKPEEVAEVVLFLASDRSSFINGAVVAVDGGQTAKVS